jgi:hypothetical protein
MQTVNNTTTTPSSNSNDYHFFTQWRVFASLKEVTDILGDATQLPRWWPSVYLDVKILEPGQPDGLGRVVDLYTKGWLPYTLRWSFTVTEITERGFRIEAQGDFVGYGVWTFVPDGDWVNISYEWVVSANKPLLRQYSALFKPIFSANHHWAMRKGEESLQLEIARRRATTPTERALIPAPPPPTTSSPLPLLAASVLVGFVAWRMLRALLR